MPRFGTYFEGLTGEDVIRVRTEEALVLGVQLGPSTLKPKGVGNAAEGVTETDGVGAVERGAIS